MGGAFELTYCDLRLKEIVNAVDGKKLGRILDLVFTAKGEIRGIVAPFGRRGFFSRCQEIFIPWRCIKKIGEDIILVEITDNISHEHKVKRVKDKRQHGDYSDQYRNYYDYDADDCDKSNQHHPPHHDDCRPPHNHSPHHDKDYHSPHHDKDCHSPHHHSPHKDDCRPPHKDDCHNKHDDGHGKHRPDCDRRCEKCMLFDCIHRWRGGEGIFVDNDKY